MRALLAASAAYPGLWATFAPARPAALGAAVVGARGRAGHGAGQR